ncbi:Uma2 family endonuclease [Mucilaginibacter ginkgonis]|uniref:Uma2 family endonuclease n=1 Tax=Mucilaginibacter ginkgonis TaxID=2682091 RepID=A0A6I4I3M2_9SPHI|nr:Uma2 family endonuclease [Mucilaginibacter ginkgonis]QQL48578.1 Uma2 family endonuclease [Mucilaginibacter ginkgonis]
MKDVLDIPRTAMEVFEMLPEGTICEVIDNTLYMSPSPTTIHQKVLGKIFTRLQMYIEDNTLGEVIFAPCDVYLDNGDSVVQPDILFIKREREAIIEKKGIYGAPDLVIELLSSNKKHDQQIKSELYRANGIPEYIIIDPETKTVWHYLLDGDTYAEQPSATGKLQIHSLNFYLEF